MSTFERDEYKWRETYFVFFDSCRRPMLRKIEQVLRELNGRFELVNGLADDDGRFESLTIISADDYAALDISFESGDEVLEQAESFYNEFSGSGSDESERAKLARLPKLDARFDLLHFEQVTANADTSDELDEMLDPSALLIVLDALVDLTKGVGVDPQSGTLL